MSIYRCEKCEKDIGEDKVEKIYAGGAVMGYACPDCKSPCFEKENSIEEGKHVNPQPVFTEKKQEEIVDKQFEEDLKEMKKKSKIAIHLKAGFRDLLISVVLIVLSFKTGGFVLFDKVSLPILLLNVLGIFFAVRGLYRIFTYKT